MFSVQRTLSYYYELSVIAYRIMSGLGEKIDPHSSTVGDWSQQSGDKVGAVNNIVGLRRQAGCGRSVGGCVVGATNQPAFA